MIQSLLADGENAGNGMPSNIIMLVILAVLIVVVIVFYVLGSKKRKKQEKDAQDLINAVKPGNKVKTIGGICGIVVEVDNEENTFVLETGTELSGKSYIKFDRQAIYQTDAVVAANEEKPVTEEVKEAEPVAEEPVATPVEEAAAPVAEEVKVEEAEKPAPKKRTTKKKPEDEEKQVKF
ncbi:MAG: preprotein translocase subunit YajC [Clostridia bacterium]|nr:preprotein translocase subunit YajC [Clostridia bacterium]